MPFYIIMILRFNWGSEAVWHLNLSTILGIKLTTTQAGKLYLMSYRHFNENEHKEHLTFCKALVLSRTAPARGMVINGFDNHFIPAKYFNTPDTHHPTKSPSRRDGQAMCGSFALIPHGVQIVTLGIIPSGRLLGIMRIPCR